MFHKYLQTPHLVLIFCCIYVLQRLVCALGMVLAKGILVTPVCHAWLAQYPEIDFPSIQGRVTIAFSYFFFFFFLLVGTLERFTIYILFQHTHTHTKDLQIWNITCLLPASRSSLSFFHKKSH